MSLSPQRENSPQNHDLVKDNTGHDCFHFCWCLTSSKCLVDLAEYLSGPQHNATNHLCSLLPKPIPAFAKLPQLHCPILTPTRADLPIRTEPQTPNGAMVSLPNIQLF